MSEKIPYRGKLLIARIKKGLYDWSKRQTEGLIPQDQILFRDQSEPLPPRPCIAMKITSGPMRTGYGDSYTSNDDGTFNVGGLRTLVISVQVFGNSAVHGPMAAQLALDLNSSLSKQTVLDGLRKYGIAVWDQGEVTNLTDIEETEFEDRAEFSMKIGVAENQQDDPGTIESIRDATGHYESDPSGDTITETFDVN